MSSGASVARTVLTATLTVLSVVGILVLVYLLRQPLTWLAIAAFLAVAVSGPVGRLSTRMPRGLAIGLVYLGVLMVPALVGLIVVPPVLRAAGDLIDQAPQYARDIQDWVNDNETLRRINEDFDLVEEIQKNADELSSRAGDAAGWLGDLGIGIVNSVFAGVTILILSIFLVANGRRPVDAALAVLVPQHADRVALTLDRMAKAVGSYIAGALVQTTIAGTLAFIVMTILGVPFAAPLAVLVGLFGLIPMVGATIAAVIVGVVTLFQDFPTTTIVWVIWAIVYQQVENTIIQPRIQKRAVGVPALGVMVAVLFGSALLGVLGALVAVPVAASLQIGVEDWRAWRAEQRTSPAGDVPSGEGPPDDGPPGSPPPDDGDPPAADGLPAPA